MTSRLSRERRGRLGAVRRRRSRHLDQHARAGARVQERDLSGQSGPRRGVEQLHAALLERRQRLADVGRFEAEMVESLAAPGQETAHRRGRPQGLEQLDLAVAGCQQGRPHSLVGDLGLTDERQPQHVAVEPVRLGQTIHDDSDVMDPSHRRWLLLTNECRGPPDCTRRGSGCDGWAARSAAGAWGNVVGGEGLVAGRQRPAPDRRTRSRRSRSATRCRQDSERPAGPGRNTRRRAAARHDQAGLFAHLADRRVGHRFADLDRPARESPLPPSERSCSSTRPRRSKITAEALGRTASARSQSRSGRIRAGHRIRTPPGRRQGHASLNSRLNWSHAKGRHAAPLPRSPRRARRSSCRPARCRCPASSARTGSPAGRRSRGPAAAPPARRQLLRQLALITEAEAITYTPRCRAARRAR